jgi:hypothetical protein
MMDAKLRPNCTCSDPATEHIGPTFDDDGMCHVWGCTCEVYVPDPFDLPPDHSDRYL